MNAIVQQPTTGPQIPPVAPPTYEASQFTAAINSNPTNGLSQNDFDDDSTKKLENLSSVKIQRKDRNNPINISLMHPFGFGSMCYNVFNEADELEVLDDNNENLYKVESWKSVKLFCWCIGNYITSVSLFNKNGEKAVSLLANHSGWSALNNPTNIVTIQNSEGQAIGKLSKEQCDPILMIGHKGRAYYQYDTKFTIYNSDDVHLYTIKGENRWNEMMTKAQSPLRKFFIYDVVDEKFLPKISELNVNQPMQQVTTNGMNNAALMQAQIENARMLAPGQISFQNPSASANNLVKTGEFQVRFSATSGCTNAWEADIENPHKLIFPESANWANKILLLASVMVIEMAITDRTTCCPGC